MRKEYDDYKADVDARELMRKKKDAYAELLKKAGVSEKRIGTIIRVSKFDTIELDKDGNIKNADALEKEAKEEWKDFIVTEGVKGADTNTPPEGSSGGGRTPSRAAIVAQKHYESIYGRKGEN